MLIETWAKPFRFGTMSRGPLVCNRCLTSDCREADALGDGMTTNLRPCWSRCQTSPILAIALGKTLEEEEPHMRW